MDSNRRICITGFTALVKKSNAWKVLGPSQKSLKREDIFSEKEKDESECCQDGNQEEDDGSKSIALVDSLPPQANTLFAEEIVLPLSGEEELMPSTKEPNGCSERHQEEKENLEAVIAPEEQKTLGQITANSEVPESETSKQHSATYTAEKLKCSADSFPHSSSHPTTVVDTSNLEWDSNDSFSLQDSILDVAKEIPDFHSRRKRAGQYWLQV